VLSENRTLTREDIDTVKAGVIQTYGVAYEQCWKFMKLVVREKLNWRVIADIKDEFQKSEQPFREDILDRNAIAAEFRKVIRVCTKNTLLPEVPAVLFVPELYSRFSLLNKLVSTSPSTILAVSEDNPGGLILLMTSASV